MLLVATSFCLPVIYQVQFRWISTLNHFPANASTLNQRWNNVDHQRSSTLFQRWYLVENESWADVHLSTLFQRCQNNVQTTLTRRFNVDEPKLFQRWNLVENESWADVCLSSLFQRWQNVEKTLKELRRFNVDDQMLFQYWYFVEKESWVNVCSSALRKQHWNNFLNICCTDVH